MSFAHPLVLLLLALPVILTAWEWRRPGHRLVLPFDHGDLPAGRRLERFIQALQMSGPILLALAILLLAGPQRMRPAEDSRVLNNVIFCLDLSGSMMAPFGDGTRSDKSLAAITEFTKRRKGDAYGLTAFGTEVLNWVPVTKDLAAIAAATPFLRPERMPSYMGGTRIGNAVREVQKTLVATPEGDRMIVLISDGESYDLGGGVAQQLGQDLGANRIALFYINVAEGDPQEETATMASLSGGASFGAEDPRALAEVFQRIDAMRPTRLQPAAPVPVDFFWPFTAAAFGCLTLQVVVALGVRFNPW
jgi:Ca-activated chloride channel family protein